jgi:hypothetical protein
MNKLAIIDVRLREQKLLEQKLTELGSHYAEPIWRDHLNDVIANIVTEHSEFDTNIHGVCEVIRKIDNFVKPLLHDQRQHEIAIHHSRGFESAGQHYNIGAMVGHNIPSHHENNNAQADYPNTNMHQNQVHSRHPQDHLNGVHTPDHPYNNVHAPDHSYNNVQAPDHPYNAHAPGHPYNTHAPDHPYNTHAPSNPPQSNHQTIINAHGPIFIAQNIQVVQKELERDDYKVKRLKEKEEDLEKREDIEEAKGSGKRVIDRIENEINNILNEIKKTEDKIEQNEKKLAKLEKEEQELQQRSAIKANEEAKTEQMEASPTEQAKMIKDEIKNEEEKVRDLQGKLKEEEEGPEGDVDEKELDEIRKQIEEFKERIREGKVELRRLKRKL